MTTPLAPPTHDLSRAVPRTEGVLSLLDALAPGQSFTLRLSPEEARELLPALTAERRGLFEWSPEVDGNAVRALFERFARGLFREERILYPMAYRVLSGPGSDELVAAIQAYEAR